MQGRHRRRRKHKEDPAQKGESLAVKQFLLPYIAWHNSVFIIMLTLELRPRMLSTKEILIQH